VQKSTGLPKPLPTYPNGYKNNLQKQTKNMQLIDTHAHIYSEQFAKDRSQMIERAKEGGICNIFMPNIDHRSIDSMLELEEKYPAYCVPMMGLHPCSVKKDFEKELYIVENWLSKKKFVAVGEMGLDLYWDSTFEAQQIEAFKIQANWAKQYKVPLIIHSRSRTEGEAMQKIIALLEDLAHENLFGILHCFTGTVADAKRLTALNFRLGIGGVVTYKNGGLEPIIQQLDLQHFVLETDCPYLAPNPHRGKRNETAYTALVAQKMADIRQVDVLEIAKITTENARKLFGN
jgi:TatD DNase family protein